MKLIYKSSLLFLLFISTILCVSGQDRFERMYRAGGTDVLSSALHEKGSGYLVLSLEINDEGENAFINLASLDSKGTIDWSMKYDYDEEDLFISELGEVEILGDGSIAFSAFLQKDSLNKLITNVDPMGNVRWSMVTGAESNVFSDNGLRSNLVPLGAGGVLHISTLAQENQTDILLSAVSVSGDIVFGQTLSAQDTMGNNLTSAVRDAILLSDSTILLVGNTMSADHQIFLTKMDTLGSILWSRSYTADLGSGLTQSAMSVTEMIDSTIVVLGAQAGSTTTGLILHLEADGTYIQSRSIASTDSQYDIIPIATAPLLDSTLAIGLKRLDLGNNVINPLLVKFGLDSTVYYQTVLKESTDIDPTRAGFISNDSISASFLTSSLKIDSVTLYPYLSKVDENGMTDCSESVGLLRFDSIFFAVDTLVWTATEQIENDSIDVLATRFGDFDPPLVQLADTTYCPQDPIMFLLDATTRGATNYLWSDGSTDSTLLVTEEGMYMVTVVVGIEECFTLCDTSNITKSEFPMVQIVQDNANFCSDGEIGLSLSSNNQIVEALWSTGETTGSIVVTDLQNYTVAIIDNCGNPAEGSLDLVDFEIMNNPAISVSGQNLCTDNTLLLVANGIFNVSDLMWSTGEVGVQSISISEPGTYSVENIAQFCPGVGSVQIIEDQFLSPLTVEVNSNCTGSAFQLTAIASTSAVSLQWEDGSSATTRLVTAAGTYAVVVTDICGDTETVSIEITQDDINDCIEVVTPPAEVCDETCLMWPNAFYPESINDGNRTFGPETRECQGTPVTNFEMKIFNRWGQVVFETTDIATRWNGQKDNSGKELPADTYFYYALFNVDNLDCNREGDVIIIR